MKAWGSKKIIRREDVAELDLTPWAADQFFGVSVQRPHLPPTEPPPAVVEVPPDMAEVLASVVTEAESMVPSEPPSADENGLSLPSEAELAAIRDAAREEGFQIGHAEGLTAGRQAGESAGREAGYQAGLESGKNHGRSAAATEVSQFQLLLAGLQQSLADYETHLAKPILDISLAVARQVLRTTLAVEPERMLVVIREALNSLPELQGNLRLELHPDDLALVQAMLASEAIPGQWRLEPNADIERGGCRIGSANIDLDLTMATRWQRIVDALGRSEMGLGGNDTEA